MKIEKSANVWGKSGRNSTDFYSIVSRFAIQRVTKVNGEDRHAVFALQTVRHLRQPALPVRVARRKNGRSFPDHDRRLPTTAQHRRRIGAVRARKVRAQRAHLTAARRSTSPKPELRARWRMISPPGRDTPDRAQRDEPGYPPFHWQTAGASMCSTIVQKSGPMDYMTALFSNVGRTRQASIARDDDAINARPLAIHCFGDTPAMDRFHWGYAPSWWKRRPVMNARLAALLRGSAVWRPLLGQRVLVPADGWYQPIGADPTASRYIRSLDGKPIYIAALTAWRPGNQHSEQDGLAIVTDDIADARSAGH